MPKGSSNAKRAKKKSHALRDKIDTAIETLRVLTTRINVTNIRTPFANEAARIVTDAIVGLGKKSRGVKCAA